MPCILDMDICNITKPFPFYAEGKSIWLHPNTFTTVVEVVGQVIECEFFPDDEADFFNIEVRPNRELS